jgi:acyl carrier protein
MTLLDQIKEVFKFELGLPEEEFSEDLKYRGAPEWDSASHMVIVLALEERFGVTFESEEVVTMSSVRAIEKALRNKGLADV